MLTGRGDVTTDVLEEAFGRSRSVDFGFFVPNKPCFFLWSAAVSVSEDDAARPSMNVVYGTAPDLVLSIASLSSKRFG